MNLAFPWRTLPGQAAIAGDPPSPLAATPPLQVFRPAHGRRLVAGSMLLALSLLAACGGGGPEDAEATTPDRQASSVTAQVEPTSSDLTLVLNPEGDVDPAATTAAGPAAAASTGILTGRVWRPGKALDSGNTSVLGYIDDVGYTAAMADDGQAFVAYAQQQTYQGRWALQVVTGRPGTGAAAVWQAPVVLDAARPASGSYLESQKPSLAVSANGQAAVLWMHSAPCLPGDLYSCRSIVVSRNNAKAGSPGSASPPLSTSPWGAPETVVTAKRVYGWVGPFKAAVNAKGDVAVVSEYSDGLAYEMAVSVSAGGTSTWKTHRLPWATGTLLTVSRHITISLDDAGGVVIAGDKIAPNGARGIAAMRGTVSGGFAATPVVEWLDNGSAGSAPSLLAVQGGRNGTVAVAWNRQTGGKSVSMVAVSDGNPVWASRDVTAAIGPLYTGLALRVPDGVAGRVSLLQSCKQLLRTNGSWPAKATALPTGCIQGVAESVTAVNRNGSFITVMNRANTAGSKLAGAWAGYDATLGRVVKTLPAAGKEVAADHVYGVSALPLPVNSYLAGQGWTLLLSANGHGLMVSSNGFMALPKPGSPAGYLDSKLNLWGVYLN